MPALNGDVLPKQDWKGLLDDPAQPLFEHIIELRRRLINSLLYLAAGSAVLIITRAALVLANACRPAGLPLEAFYTRLRPASSAGCC